MNSQQKKRKPSGCPQSEVWKNFEKKPLKSAGHFSAKCNYCKKFWTRGHLQQLEEHLANNCKESPELVYAFYLGVVSSRDFGSEDTTAILLSENNKKRKIQTEQRELTDWFESTNIPLKKKLLLLVLLPGYMPSSRELLGGRLLNQEMARVNEKVKKIIEDSENLTL
ncbi:8721_t:CDS:2, partial [Rhizophagus irregularis]